MEKIKKEKPAANQERKKGMSCICIITYQQCRYEFVRPLPKISLMFPRRQVEKELNGGENEVILTPSNDREGRLPKVITGPWIK